MFYLLTTDKEEIRISSPTLLHCPRQTIRLTDDDFNFRTPTNNASIELKKRVVTKKKKITWTGYKCRSCGSSGSTPGNIPPAYCAFCHSPNIEKTNSDSNRRPLKLVSYDKCELEGPYECPWCGGHIMLDVTYLDQVSTIINCLYCNNVVYVSDKPVEDI